MLFPYKYRKYQPEIIQLCDKCLCEKKNLVFEASTGIGKTICVLYPVVNYALENNKKIIYLTRTKSQQQLVIQELKAINSANNTNIFGVGIQGRNNLCFLLNNEDISDSTPEELAEYCKTRKNTTLRNPESDKICIYYKALLENENILDNISKKLLTTEELKNYCFEKRICAYELLKELIPQATVLVAPYIYFFYKPLYEKLFTLINTQPQDIILVIDEAHNLLDYLRELYSLKLSQTMIKKAKNELKEHGDLEILNVNISEFLDILENIVIELCESISDDEEDLLLPQNEHKIRIIGKLKFTSIEFTKYISQLIDYGKWILNEKKLQSKLPRSYIYRIGKILELYDVFEAPEYIKLVETGNAVECYCLDVSKYGNNINECHASIHISGTLAPLKTYTDLLGISNTLCKIFPNPYEKENFAVKYISDVTTKYSELIRDSSIIKRIKNYLIDIVSATDKNTIVFYPSFKLMNSFYDIIPKISRYKNIYIEKQNMSQSELIENLNKFRATSNNLLFSVISGRLSEGIDFPAQSLELVILVGLPYPKPTAKQRALYEYYDIKYGKGWDYAVFSQMLRKTKQCLGRVIRSETDRGMGIILDYRTKYIETEINAIESSDIIYDMKNFFK